MYRPRSSPYGNIYSINTNAIDNIAKQVYLEQKQREQQKLQQDKALDDEFAKNVAGVKSADIPEITSAYNDFKQAHINLQKKGNKATPQDQMDVMLKKAAAFQAINASKEEKERVKNAILEGRADKNGKFIPDYQQVLTRRLNTPTSKVKDEDFDIANKYSFKDLDKFTKDMMGTPKPLKIPTGEPSKKGELYDDKNVYNVIKNPNQMYDEAYLKAFSRADREGLANSVLNSISDQEKEDLKTRYFAKINSPEFKALYGEVKPFNESAGNTKLGQAIALMTMGVVDNLSLDPVDTISEVNAERATKQKQDFAKEQQGRGFAHSEKMAALNQGYRIAFKEFTSGVDAAADEKVLNTFIKNTIDNGVSGSKATIGGVTYNGTVTDLPKDLNKQYVAEIPDPNNKGYVIDKEPDRWFFTEDGKKAIPLYYVGDANFKGKSQLIPNPNQKPIDIQNLKFGLSKVLISQKQRGGEVIEQFDGSGVQQQSPSGNKPAKTKTINVTTNKQTIPGWN